MATTKTSRAPSLQKKLREMELLLDLSRKVAEADNLDQVLQTIVATAATETHADRGTLFLHDERTGELLGLEWLSERLAPKSPYGARIFAQIVPFRRGDEEAAQGRAQQIGRASCRERVYACV